MAACHQEKKGGKFLSISVFFFFFLNVVALEVSCPLVSYSGRIPRKMLDRQRGNGQMFFSRRENILRTWQLFAASSILSRPKCANAESEPINDNSIPQGVIILRIAEVTAVMENLLLKAAHYQEDGSGEEIVIGRQQMPRSVEILIEQSRLDSVSNSDRAIQKLRSIANLAESGKGVLTARELTEMATRYSSARDELRFIFERYTVEEQQEFKAIFRRMQQIDEEFKKEALSR